jgi:hypothetical protein
MVVHVNNVSLARAAVVAPMRLQWLQNTLEALILVFCEVWLTRVEKCYKSFVAFARQTLQIEAHALDIMLFKIHFQMAGSRRNSLRVAWLGQPHFKVSINKRYEKVDYQH